MHPAAGRNRPGAACPWLAVPPGLRRLECAAACTHRPAPCPPRAQAHKRGLDASKLRGSGTPAWGNLRGRSGSARKQKSYFEGPEDEDDELEDQPSGGEEGEEEEEHSDEEEEGTSEEVRGRASAESACVQAMCALHSAALVRRAPQPSASR